LCTFIDNLCRKESRCIGARKSADFNAPPSADFTSLNAAEGTSFVERLQAPPTNENVSRLPTRCCCKRSHVCEPSATCYVRHSTNLTWLRSGEVIAAMSEPRLQPPKRAATFATARSPDLTPSAAVRQRLPQRQTSNPSLNGSLSPGPALNRRRSSILSYSSIDEVAQSLRDDFINPSTKGARTTSEDEEVTHWHSTPLAFAILPAIGGLLFKNGTAFVTDILLLGLAAIFMNWSIKLPWDWYYSAQLQRRAVDPDDLPIPLLDDNMNEEIAVETSSADVSPKPEPEEAADAGVHVENEKDVGREDAAAELRRQEKLALFSTFLFPILAAYLIHVIRGQLSTSSTGLVSDFNLSIFLLAAEIRPCRQLIRLVTNRTIHLQRIATGAEDPFGAVSEGKNAISSLTARIAELEAKLSDHTIVPQDMTLAQKHDVSDLSAELRKRYEPRLEGLERAMRRYEKRSATMAMVTDQKLGQLESTLQDTLSLAAQAARQSQSRGVFAKALESMSALFALPMQVVWGLVMWPVHVLDIAYTKLRAILFGSAPSKLHKRKGSAVRDEKGKGTARKPIR
jgi:hypothetical protein